MKKKIIECGEPSSISRKDFWMSHCENTKDWEFESILLDDSNFQKEWKRIQNDFDGVLISEQQSDYLLTKNLKVPRRIMEAHLLDCLFRDSAGLWMHSLIRDSLHELIVKKAPQLDTLAMGYVTGSGSLMRMSLSVLIQLGYKVIYIVVEEVETVQFLKDEVLKNYFGVELRVIKNSELTLQTNDGTILINTVPLEGKTDLIEDLTYLNFLYGDGIVVETNVLPLHHQLIDESKQVGHRILSGAELFAHRDWSFIKKVDPSFCLSFESYLEHWMHFLEK